MATSLYTLPSLPCALPTAAVPDEVDLTSIASQTQKALSNLTQDDFCPDAIWRDSFALTGTLRTFYSAGAVFKAWTETSATHRPGRFTIGPAPLRVVRMATGAWVDVPFTFETAGVPSTTCSGFASMALDGGWKIWVLRTILEGLKGEPSVDVLEPVANSGQDNAIGETMNGVVRVNGNGEHITTTPVDSSTGSKGASRSVNYNNDSNSPNHYGCVIIGGGQAGLSTGGRLQALGVSYVILEKNDEVGDNWKTRYDSTKRMCPTRFQCEIT
jgi:hypothetical protein